VAALQCFVEAHYGVFRIVSMANTLEMKRSTIYDHLKREKGEPIKFTQELIDSVHNIWEDHKGIYGLRRILREVKKTYPDLGSRRVRKIMHMLKIEGIQSKKYRVLTTDSKHDNRIAPDLVQRDFSPSEKNKVWVSDVTYLRWIGGHIYLCIVMDLFSRRVVGWSVSRKNDSSLVISALRNSINSRNPKKGLIFHSDRGSNYTSNETRLFLVNNRIRRSNSRKGNCWDNAVAESFFAGFKREIDYACYGSLREAKEILFEHIEVFYNRQRSHSKLGYKSPMEFE
jgi:putative transposase